MPLIKMLKMFGSSIDSLWSTLPITVCQLYIKLVFRLIMQPVSNGEATFCLFPEEGPVGDCVKDHPEISLIHTESNSVLKGCQVHESKLNIPDYLLVLFVLENGFQWDVLHCLYREQGEAEQPVVSRVVFLLKCNKYK